MEASAPLQISNGLLAKTFESKRAFRRELADRPIAEKLRMLDDLRECTLAIRRASGSRKKAIVRERPLTDPP